MDTQLRLVGRCEGRGYVLAFCAGGGGGLAMSIDFISNATCWADFERSLAALGADQKGRLFEELTRLYLLTDPTLRPT